MAKTIYISAVRGRRRVALTEGGELIEFHTEREALGGKIVGNIYKGQVANVLSGMQAAFVNIGLIKNAFLYTGDDTLVEKEDVPQSPSDEPPRLKVKEGDEIMVQVVKDQFGTKGARVTMDISLPGRLVVLMPHAGYVGVSKKITDEAVRERLCATVTALKPEGAGFVVRTAAAQSTDAEIKADMDFLLESYRQICERFECSQPPATLHEEGDLVFRTIRDMFSEDVERVVVNDERVFGEVQSTVLKISPRRSDVVRLYEGTEEMFAHFNLMEQIEGLLERKVPLKNGAHLVIDKTEALTIIDINTGKYVGSSNLEETVYSTNLLAAMEIARQIRLRNIGGIIICDFIDMVSEEHRDEVLRVLSQHLQRDRIRTTLLGMTGLGLVEITRKKTHNEISSVLLQSCPYCQGDGAVHSAEFVCFKIRARLYSELTADGVLGAVLFVSPEIADYIQRSRYFSPDIERRWQDKRIYMVTRPGTHMESFELKAVKTPVFDLPEGARLLY